MNDTHLRLAMNRRRWTAFFALPFAAVFLFSGIGGAAMAISQVDGNLGKAIAALCVFSGICVSVPVGRSSWKALTDKGPALVVDSRGITDQFHLHTFLPWTDIQSASVDYGDGGQLTIILRAGVITPSVSRTIKRAFTGGDLAIPLSSLSYNPNKLKELLKHYLKRR